MAVVRDSDAMIAGMSPALDTEIWHFCSTNDRGTLGTTALACFEEEEGLSVILPASTAEAHGFDTAFPMARITLRVHSALDGVGLTAAVAGILAKAGIACNMVAAYHHDHAFVPWAQREEALSLLQALAQQGEA